MKLEEKRAEAITIIDFKIRQTATRTCRYCPIATYIPSIIAAIGNNLSPKIALWPPRYDRYSIRDMLIAIHSVGRFRASEGYDFQFCPYHRNLTVEAKADFRKVAKDASRLMLGAYYCASRTVSFTARIVCIWRRFAISLRGWIRLSELYWKVEIGHASTVLFLLPKNPGGSRQK